MFVRGGNPILPTPRGESERGHDQEAAAHAGRLGAGAVAAFSESFSLHVDSRPRAPRQFNRVRLEKQGQIPFVLAAQTGAVEATRFQGIRFRTLIIGQMPRTAVVVSMKPMNAAPK
jgi:hypothetical protein